MADPMRPELFRVAGIRRETHDTFTMQLRPPAPDRRFAFAPGQFNMLYVFGAGEVPISISGDPRAPELIVHTTRSVGAVTRAMRDLQVGDPVGVRGPFGAGWPLSDAGGKDVVIIAGGIGMAPLRPAIYELLAERERYRRIALLYGTRTPADILFRRELERWRARFDIDVQVTVDRALGHWCGHVGVVTSLIARTSVDFEQAVAFACGPEVMMRFAAMELEKRGLGPDRIFLSLERNMKCGIGWCGHCQLGPMFVCREGPVFPYAAVKRLERIREL